MENKTIKATAMTDAKQTPQTADEKQLEIIAKRILKKNKRAFEVLGQW